MPHPPDAMDFHAARCMVRDPSAFLRELRAIAAEIDTHIICFNADLVAGRVHAATAVSLAIRAFDEGVAISNTLEMESLLFAAGTRQCAVASSFGIHEGENTVCICCYPARAGIRDRLRPLFTFISGDADTISPEKREKLMTAFGISHDELEAAGGEDRIVDLVLERVVLLQVIR